MKCKYDHTGEQFGKWVVLSRAPRKQRNDRWYVSCNCGTNSIVLGAELRKGASRGCKKCHKITHGMSKTRTFTIWMGIKDRCNNPSNYSYYSYGGRGITICKSWNEQFFAFLSDMGEAPNGQSIDRIDNEKGYFKENCRWADHFTQARNTRKFIINGTTRGNWELKERIPSENKAVITCIFCGKSRVRAFANFRQNRIGKCKCIR